MSLHPQTVYLVPEETARVARAAFPRGNNLYMRMRDALGTIFEDQQFAHLFSHTGQPAVSPYRLALVTIMQFAEGLSDQQAAAAVRCRIDWKYALSLELTDPGFDSSVLCEFRTRLLVGGAEHLLFETLLTVLRAQGFTPAGYPNDVVANVPTRPMCWRPCKRSIDSSSSARPCVPRSIVWPWLRLLGYEPSRRLTGLTATGHAVRNTACPMRRAPGTPSQ